MPDNGHAATLLGQQVTGAALGMVGLGRIGYQVARRTAGFDMDILSTNRNRNERAEWDLGVRYRPRRAAGTVRLRHPELPPHRGVAAAPSAPGRSPG